jgi:hypothetical protein
MRETIGKKLLCYRIMHCETKTTELRTLAREEGSLYAITLLDYRVRASFHFILNLFRVVSNKFFLSFKHMLVCNAASNLYCKITIFYLFIEDSVIVLEHGLVIPFSDLKLRFARRIVKSSS